MMKKTFFVSIFCIFFSTLAYAHSEKHVSKSSANEWQKITPEKSMDVIDANGNVRTIFPRCSGGPMPDGTLDSSEYSFFFKRGKSDKLVVFFEGGGACWDTATCNSSIRPDGAYIPTLVQTIPGKLNGIFDQANHDNPLRKHSILYIPYCTGDIHSGSKDRQYLNVLGLPDANGIVQPTITIHHRGLDNFLAARHWVKARFDKKHVEHLVVAGNSAGAYGAAMGINYLAKDFSKADAVLLLDGGNGIVNSDFAANAMSDSGSWGYQASIPAWTSGISEAVNASFSDSYAFSVAFFSATAMNNPTVKVGQFSNNWDAVQTLFYNIMNVQAAGGTPGQWAELTPTVFGEWILNSNIAFNTLANIPNYRFFLAPGCEHTFLRSQRLYTTQSAGTTLLDWVHHTLSDEQHDWNNVRCVTASCLPPTPTTLAEVSALKTEIGRCVQSAQPKS